MGNKCPYLSQLDVEKLKSGTKELIHFDCIEDDCKFWVVDEFDGVGACLVIVNMMANVHIHDSHCHIKKHDCLYPQKDRFLQGCGMRYGGN
jgi:hypothetical protein